MNEDERKTREVRMAVMMEREAKMRLFQQLHQDDDPEWYRANGSVKCGLCGVLYRCHPYSLEHPLWGEVVDHRLCNGDVVHL